MAQQRYFNYKEDDKTNLLNRQFIGIMPYGLYRGFDAVLAAGLSLQLEHSTTGYDEVDIALNLRTGLGLVNSKQGTLVIEDAPLFLPISANASSDPRIDLIVMEHEYLTVIGGQPAIYKVIQGIPAATPVAPALTDPNKQVILGELYCPAGMTSLTDAGVVYTKATTPLFSNDPTIMRTHLSQYSTGDKRFAYLRTGDAKEAIRVGTDLDFQNAKSNTYYTMITGGVPFYLQIDNFINLLSLGEGYEFKMVTGQPILLTRTGNIAFSTAYGNELRLDAGDTIQVWDLNSLGGFLPAIPNYYVTKGGEATRYDTNKFRKLQSWVKAPLRYGLSGAIDVNLNKEGNLYQAEFNTGATIRSISDNNTDDLWIFLPPHYMGGTVIWFKVVTSPIGGSITVEHNASGLGSGYKPIISPTGANLVINDGDTIGFIEHEDRWEVISVMGVLNQWSNQLALNNYITSQTDETWKYFGAVGNMANGQPIPTFGTGVSNQGGTLQTARLRKKGGGTSIELQGAVTHTGMNLFLPFGILGILPIGYRPLLDISIPITFSDSSNVFYTGLLYISSSGMMLFSPSNGVLTPTTVTFKFEFNFIIPLD